MSTQVVLNVMLELLGIISIGYFLAKMKLLDKDFSDKLSFLVVNVTMPMYIIASVIGKEGRFTDVLDYILYGFVFYISSIVVAYICCKLLFINRNDIGICQFMLIFSNCSFMGYPVIAAIAGKDAIFYMSIFNIPFNILAFSYGIFLISKGKDGSAKFNPVKLINPGIIASLLSVLIYAMRLKFPLFISSVFSNLGEVTTPISMLVLGVCLAQIPIKELVGKIKIYPISLIKLVVFPIVTFYIVSIFTSEPMLIAVATTTAAMPVASMSVMLSTLYGGNEKLASIGVFVTTLLSVISVPLVLGYLL